MDCQLKNTLNRFYYMCDNMDRSLLVSSKTGIATRDCVEAGLTKFILFLAAADGSVSLAETQFYNEYFDCMIDVNQMLEYIREYDLLDDKFIQTVPSCLQILVTVDNFMIDSCYEGDNMLYDYSHTSSEVLITLYRELGKEFLACDKDIFGNKANAFNAYIKLLEDYAASHTNS